MKDLTIVVGTIGQSIMRSEDNGQTWARIGPRRGFAYEASVRCIAMNPKRPTTLFAGTERGLYRSEDAGANWQYIDSALNPHYIWAIGIDPVNPDNMFVGTGTPTPAMLFRSKDGGRTWEKRPVEVAAECEAVGTPRFTGIAVDPVEPKNIWVSLEVDGARHSSDGGETWEVVEVTGRKDIHNVAVTAGPPKTVFIMANREIYASTDNGATWETRACRPVFPGSIREKKRTCAASPLIRQIRKASYWDLATLRRDHRAPSRAPTISARAGSCCPCRWSRIPRCGRLGRIPRIRTFCSRRAATVIFIAATTAGHRGRSYDGN